MAKVQQKPMRVTTQQILGTAAAAALLLAGKATAQTYGQSLGIAYGQGRNSVVDPNAPSIEAYLKTPTGRSIAARQSPPAAPPRKLAMGSVDRNPALTPAPTPVPVTQSATRAVATSLGVATGLALTVHLVLGL